MYPHREIVTGGDQYRTHLELYWMLLVRCLAEWRGEGEVRDTALWAWRRCRRPKFAKDLSPGLTHLGMPEVHNTSLQTLEWVLEDGGQEKDLSSGLEKHFMKWQLFNHVGFHRWLLNLWLQCFDSIFTFTPSVYQSHMRWLVLQLLKKEKAPKTPQFPKAPSTWGTQTCFSWKINIISISAKT